MKKLFIVLSFLFLSIYSQSQNKTIQERLGYQKDTKLVIIHADDLGVSHSQNMASISAWESGVVSSGSIMVPCPWFPEIAHYFVEHPSTDLGLHLTLNSEWNYYKWSSVSSKDEVPSLLDSMGYLYATTEQVVKNASLEEVEKELRNQIERAIAFGVDPTHFDAHMGTAFSSQDFAEIYIQLGREYKVPVLINAPAFKMLYNIDVEGMLNESDVQVNNVVMASPQDFESGMAEFYTKALKSLQVITWREIRDKLVRK